MERDEVLDAIAARGFNLLRLSVFWEQVEPEQGEYDQAYLDDIDAVITSAEQRGIWVVVSFHQDTFGSAFGGHGIPPWATKDDGLPFEDTGSFLTNYLQPGVQAAWENLYEDPDIRAAQAATWTHVAAEYSDHPNVIGYDLLNEPFGKIREGEDLHRRQTGRVGPTDGDVPASHRCHPHRRRTRLDVYRGPEPCITRHRHLPRPCQR